MYRVKGQDQKEYGPVDAAQVRQWLAQGRVDAQSPARLESAADWRPLGSFPEFATVTPPPFPRPAAAPPPDNTIATIIPYHNASALIAYYLGVFSLIPCVGFFLGIAAIIFGIMGLKRARQSPEARGKVHAWIGVILGSLVFVAHILLAILFFVAASRKSHGNGAGWHL